MSDETCLISVVIPYYNTDKKLMDRCINSVLNQTEHSFECIIVDDGSSEEYTNYLSEYEKENDRIKVIHKENKGLGSTRNYGVSAANGEYVFFLDSDDYLSPFVVERGIDIALETKADMIVGGLQHISSTETPTFTDGKNVLSIIESKDDKKKYINHISIASQEEYLLKKGRVGVSACGKFVKRELAKKVPFDECKYWDEDNIWSLSIAYECQKIVIVDTLWYYYVINPNSMIRGYAGDRTKEFQYRAKQEYQLFIKLWPECIQGAYHHMWSGLLTYCRTDVFHPDNPNSNQQKYYCFRNAIDFDELKTSIRKIDFSSEKRVKYRVVKQTIKHLLLLPNKRYAYYLLRFCNKKIVF